MFSPGYPEKIDQRTPEELIRYMEVLSENATSENEVRGYAEVAKHLRAELDKQKEAESVRETGYGSSEAAMSAKAQKTKDAEAAKKAERDASRANHVAALERDYQRTSRHLEISFHEEI